MRVCGHNTFATIKIITLFANFYKRTASLTSKLIGCFTNAICFLVRLVAILWHS
jgi:hypothetical protein